MQYKCVAPIIPWAVTLGHPTPKLPQTPNHTAISDKTIIFSASMIRGIIALIDPNFVTSLASHSCFSWKQGSQNLGRPSDTLICFAGNQGCITSRDCAWRKKPAAWQSPHPTDTGQSLRGQPPLACLPELDLFWSQNLLNKKLTSQAGSLFVSLF